MIQSAVLSPISSAVPVEVGAQSPVSSKAQEGLNQSSFEEALSSGVLAQQAQGTQKEPAKTPTEGDADAQPLPQEAPAADGTVVVLPPALLSLLAQQSAPTFLASQTPAGEQPLLPLLQEGEPQSTPLPQGITSSTAVVSILEGMRNTDMASLPLQQQALVANLQQLQQQVLDSSSAPLTDGQLLVQSPLQASLQQVAELSGQAAPLQARMPSTVTEQTPTAELQSAQATLEDSLEAGAPCPIENGNEADAGQDQAGKNPLPQTPFVVDTTSGRLDLSALRTQAQGALSAAQPAVTTDQLLPTLVERMVFMDGEAPRLEIALKPDHLGSVTVELVLGEQGLTAKLSASDEGVRNLLSAQMHSLAQTLEEKGIRVAEFEVAYAPLSDQGQNRPQPDHSGKEPRYNGGEYGVDAVGQESGELAAENPYLDEGADAPVEYRA